MSLMGYSISRKNPHSWITNLKIGIRVRGPEKILFLRLLCYKTDLLLMLIIFMVLPQRDRKLNKCDF